MSTPEIAQALLAPSHLLHLTKQVQKAKWREIGYRFASKADEAVASNDLATADLINEDSFFVKTKTLFRVTPENLDQTQKVPLPEFFDGVFAEAPSGKEVQGLLRGWEAPEKVRLCFIKDPVDVLSPDKFGCDIKIGTEEVIFSHGKEK